MRNTHKAHNVLFVKCFWGCPARCTQYAISLFSRKSFYMGVSRSGGPFSVSATVTPWMMGVMVGLDSTPSR